MLKRFSYTSALVKFAMVLRQRMEDIQGEKEKENSHQTFSSEEDSDGKFNFRIVHSPRKCFSHHLTNFLCRPKGVKMGIGRALLLLPSSGASLLSLLLSKCHLAATFLTLATSLLPALVVSYGPQMAGPLPATFTFSNRSDPTHLLHSSPVFCELTLPERIMTLTYSNVDNKAVMQ